MYNWRLAADMFSHLKGTRFYVLWLRQHPCCFKPLYTNKGVKLGIYESVVPITLFGERVGKKKTEVSFDHKTLHT